MVEPARPVRRGFISTLDAVYEKVNRLFALVTERLVAATDSFLSADREEARSIADRDELIDTLEKEIEALVERTMLFQAPVASDFHRLLTALRIVPELERSGDLAEHVAAEAARGFGRALTPPLRGAVQDMGDIAGAMWRRCADAFRTQDGEAATELDRTDDELDAIHRRFVDEAAEQLTGEDVSSAALVGRYYERLGDHAVNIAGRICYLATGRPQRG